MTYPFPKTNAVAPNNIEPLRSCMLMRHCFKPYYTIAPATKQEDDSTPKKTMQTALHPDRT